MANYYHDFHRRSARFERSRIKRQTKPLWLVLTVLFLIFFSIFFFLNNIIREDKTKSDSVVVESLKPDKKKGITKDELILKIKDIFEENVGAYSVYVYEINQNQGFGINEETVFTAASVAKIPILAALYYLTDKGEIDLDQTITLRKEDIQDFGTGILRYQKPGNTYSLKTLARLMMEKSDNTAAHILGRIRIGFPRIQEIIEEWGLTQTEMENNKTSTGDMAILMTKIYREEITNKSLTREMLGFMDETDFEDRLPKFIPENVKVYHKTGDEINNTHDVGIVDLPNNPYYIGIMTLDLLKGEQEAKEAIAKVSKLIYDYYTLI